MRTRTSPRGCPALLGGAVGAAAVLASLWAAAPAASAPIVFGDDQVVSGDDRGAIVQLAAQLDRDAAQRMEPGEAVSWFVTVSATRDDGRIAVSLDGTAPVGAFTVTVHECREAWREGACPEPERGARLLAAGQRHPLGSLPSSQSRWYRFDVALDSDAPRGATARLVVHAAGRGTSAPGDAGQGALAPTGVAVAGLFAPALTALAAGLGLAGLARWRRGGARADGNETSGPALVGGGIP